MTDERGLVMSPPIEVVGTRVEVKSPQLDPQEVRHALLFWDSLAVPQQSVIRFDLGGDAQFLAGEGILVRPRVSVPGGQLSDILRAAHVGSFRALDEKEPGRWSLATGERSISFADEELIVGRGTLVRLHHAIPVPDRDVPLADVLKFRSRRRAELLALRHHLEDVYGRVIAAGDGPLAWQTEIKRLQQSIADHIKASHESRLKFRWSGLNANLNLVKGATAFAAAEAMGLSLPQALISGAVASLSVSTGAGLTRHQATATPFRYVSAFHEELFPGTSGK